MGEIRGAGEAQARELVTQLEAVSAGAAQGLSLTAAAALAGVLRRPLVSWVRLADEGIEPLRAWLTAICRRDAEARQRFFASLEQLATVDVGAVRDYRRARGAPTELERELVLLRKLGMGRQARLDARKLQRELENGETKE